MLWAMSPGPFRINPMDDETQARLEALKSRLKAREGKPSYKQNVLDLKAEIARLEALDGE